MRILYSKIRELCYALMLQKYTIMLQKYAIMLLSKIIFRDWLTAILLLRRHRLERSAAFSRANMLSGSALVMLELLEASSPKSSTSSPSLMTVVNLVPETKATSYYYNQSHCVRLIKSRGNCACAIPTGLKNNQIMPA